MKRTSLLLAATLYVTIVSGQICGNRGLEHWLPYVIDGPEFENPEDALTINTYWYIVRDDNGNGTLSISEVEEMIQRTKDAFDSHGIRLVQKCDYAGNAIIELLNTSLYQASVEEQEICLFSQFCADEWIEYFYPRPCA